MLRRYFATTLSNPIDGDLDTIMPSEYIDAFEGRSKNSMISIYAKKNSSELKKVYMKYMYRLVIDLESYKFKDIEDENKELQLKVDKVDLLEDKLKKIEEKYDLIFENNKKMVKCIMFLYFNHTHPFLCFFQLYILILLMLIIPIK